MRSDIIVLVVNEYGRLWAARRERFRVLPVYASDELCKHPLKLSRDREPVRPRIRHHPVESTDRAWWKCSEDQISKATVQIMIPSFCCLIGSQYPLGPEVFVDME